MELKATRSKKRTAKKRGFTMDYGVFLEVANDYNPIAKTSVVRGLKTTNKPDKGRKAVKPKSIFEEVSSKYAQNVDPTQTQVGESIYDETDTELMVVENDPTTTEVVVMPKDQAQQPVPQGVKTVDEAELGTYTVQPTAGQPVQQPVAKKAEVDIDWDDIQSASIDVLAYARKEDPRGIVEALDYLNFLILDQVEAPEDMDMGSMFARIGRKKSDLEVLSEFEKEVEMEVEDIEDVEGLPAGESGYTEIMQDIQTMVAEDTPVVDLILVIGEKYPRDMGEKVLADARSRGIL